MASHQKAIGKEKHKKQNLPKKILLDKKSITETKSVAENLNKYFTQIGPKLVQTWQKILVHQLQVLMSTLRDMALPSQKSNTCK